MLVPKKEVADEQEGDDHINVDEEMAQVTDKFLIDKFTQMFV
jgi:hypothetical protein